MRPGQGWVVLLLLGAASAGTYELPFNNTPSNSALPNILYGSKLASTGIALIHELSGVPSLRFAALFLTGLPRYIVSNDFYGRELRGDFFNPELIFDFALVSSGTKSLVSDISPVPGPFRLYYVDSWKIL